MSKHTSLYGLISSLYVFVFIVKRLHYARAISQSEIANHLEMGKQLLARGQYADALSHYHAAIEGDPSNYQSYYRRATAYLALGKSKPALEDLNEVIALKPDFASARFQRGTILLKQGFLEDAHIDFEWVLRVDPHNGEAHQYYALIEPLKQDIELAHEMQRSHNPMGAVEVLTRVMVHCPWDIKLREMRADAYEQLGDLVNAISDLRPTTKMTADNTGGYLRLSQLYYKHADVDESLAMIRECLKLDPDHKDCFAHYKKVKKLAQQLKAIQELIGQQEYAACAEKGQNALRTEQNVAGIVQFIKGRICHCQAKGGAEPSEAIETCSEALKLKSDDVNALCDRADAFLLLDEFENALHDYQRAHQLDENSQRAAEGIKRAQKMEKRSSSRDYYKILGVKKTATKKEILKAYRKLAQQWHPDQFQNESEKKKKEAEKKFIDIASAKEVLTDPEKRKRFDEGEDPLDPESNQGRGFNPFGGGGFNPFSGGHSSGGYTFKFVFN